MLQLFNAFHSGLLDTGGGRSPQAAGSLALDAPPQSIDSAQLSAPRPAVQSATAPQSRHFEN